MNNLIINSIKQILETSNFNDESSKYLNFYEGLKEFKESKLIYTELQKWFEEIFKIHLLEITVYSKYEDEKDILFQSFSDEKCGNTSLHKHYDININPFLIISFCLSCKTQKQFDELEKHNSHVKTFLYMISLQISSVSYQEIVKKLTFKDSLTNTYNRKFLIEHLSKLLPLSKRESKNISFLLIGVDHFKAVIDEFNYEIGDKVLINLANILKESIRESDLLVRLEGDEFLITLVGISDVNDAQLVAQKLIGKFAQSEVVVNKEGHVLKKTICVGITHYDYKTDVDTILKNADISLNEAKNLGRGRIKEYFPEDESCVELF